MGQVGLTRIFNMNFFFLRKQHVFAIKKVMQHDSQQQQQQQQKSHATNYLM